MSVRFELPQELKQQIIEYIPRDRDMKSSLTGYLWVELGDFRFSKFHMSYYKYQEKVKPDDLVEHPSFYDFYFNRGHNQTYKYSYGKLLQFRGYKHRSCFSEKELWENRFECEGEYVKIIGPHDDDDAESNTDSDIELILNW